MGVKVETETYQDAFVDSFKVRFTSLQAYTTFLILPGKHDSSQNNLPYTFKHAQ